MTKNALPQEHAFSTLLKKGGSPVFILCLALVLFLLGGVAGFRYHAYLFPQDAVLQTADGQLAAGTVAVHVAGAVESPGLYELEATARVQDALLQAGLAENADTEQLNLAAYVTDGMKIHVPQKALSEPTDDPGMAEEEAPADAPAAQTSPDGKININTATAAELEQLNGIGPTKAEAIVQYREAHGLFTSLQQITSVSGIGDATYEKIKDDITL